MEAKALKELEMKTIKIQPKKKVIISNQVENVEEIKPDDNEKVLDIK